jgi:GNAT superfamily N-acetyltransferase
MLEKPMDHGFAHRLAVPADMPVLEQLMQAAIRQLLPQFLSSEKVEASFALMGLDTQLIEDRTYFVLKAGERIAGCGGWSRRATLFGHNQTGGRDARLLDPATEAARVRAMYTDPAFIRRGVGRRILALCEAAALSERFSRTELGRRGRTAVPRLRLYRHRTHGGAHAPRHHGPDHPHGKNPDRALAAACSNGP